MLNEDVLRQIFIEIQRESDQRRNLSDLLSAALVCSAWAACAQEAICHKVVLHIRGDPIQDARPASFVRIMRTCPHLLRSIRHIVISVSALSPPAELLGWISWIPQDTLMHFDLCWHHLSAGPQWQDVLFRAPAVRTVRRLTLADHFWVDALQSIAACSQLEELTIGIHRFSSVDDVGLGMATGDAFSKLRVAALTSFVGKAAIYLFLSLAMSFPRLEHLRLLYLGLDVPDELVTALRSMAPTLKELLVFFGQEPSWPFMDDAVLRLSSLEMLSLSPALYSTALLQRLPRTLRRVRLQASPSNNALGPGSGPAALEYVTRAIKTKAPLKRVELIHWHVPDDLRTPSILDTSLQGGISCRITPLP